MDMDNFSSISGMDFSQIFFKCEVQLLKKQILSSYGFPLMQLSEEKINHFLKNMRFQKYEVQEQMVEAVACLIGETTVFEQKDDCFNIILERLKQMLNNNGILFSFKSHKFNQRVAELFNRVYEMPNHQAIISKQFRCDEFFLLLDQKQKETIQQYQLNTSSVIYESKSQKYRFYMQQMCDIEEYQYVRELRKYINSLLLQYEKFRSLQELINFNQNENSIEIINEKYSQIYEETQTLKNSFQIIQSNNNIDGQKFDKIISSNNQEMDKIISSINQESSTINTANNIEESKKSKKIEKLSKKQNFITISDDEDNDENQFKNTENLYKVDNDFIRQEIFGELKNKEWENIYQSILHKQIEYSKKLQLFKQLGLPSIKYKPSDFSKILSNYAYQTFPKQKQSLQIVISLIWESLNINKTQQPADVVKKKLSNILHYFGINYQNQKQVIQSLVAQSFQLIYKVENQLNVQQPFNYFQLNNLLNQPLPDFIFKLDNSKTEIAFKAKSMTLLKNFDQTQEILNVRIIRKYLISTQKILIALVNFPLQRNCDSHIKQTIIKQFTELENLYHRIQSQPLNFSLNQTNPELSINQSISETTSQIQDYMNSNDQITNEESISNQSTQNNHMEITQSLDETNSLGQSYRAVKLNSSTIKLGSQPEALINLQ